MKITAKKISKGMWSYKGVIIWRSDFSDGDCYPPSFVRWELTDEASNWSIDGCFKTLREAKQFVDKFVIDRRNQ